MTKSEKNKKITDKFVNFAVKLGNVTFLATLRDAFAYIMPLFILAGLAVLVNAVIFPKVAAGETLENLQTFGNVITNGTLNIAGLLLTPAIAYSLCKRKNIENPISAMIVSLSTLIVMMPENIIVNNIDGESVEVAGGLAYSNMGTTGMFAGIIIGFLSTLLFIELTKSEKIKIKLGENVPPAVSNSFSILLPAIFTISLFAILALIIKIGLKTDLVTLIITLVQEPFRKINTSLPGYLFLYSFGNFLFTLGIHQSVINGPFTEPFMLQNINENMLAIQKGIEAPHILTVSFQTAFVQMGGTGATISLIIAIFLFSKYKPSKQIAKLSLMPGIFEINEPIIFGYPIVYNLPMIIPFVFLPILQTLIAYFATVMGWISKTIVMVPWITPPIISGYVATGGDWRASLLQIILIIIGVLIYLPFMRISEKVAKKNLDLK